MFLYVGLSSRGHHIYFFIMSLYADMWVSNAFRQKYFLKNYCKQNIYPTHIPLPYIRKVRSERFQNSIFAPHHQTVLGFFFSFFGSSSLTRLKLKKLFFPLSFLSSGFGEEEPPPNRPPDATGRNGWDCECGLRFCCDGPGVKLCGLENGVWDTGAEFCCGRPRRSGIDGMVGWLLLCSGPYIFISRSVSLSTSASLRRLSFSSASTNF